MNILITGGTGFIGQAVTKHFLKQSHKITIIGRSCNKITRLFQNRVSAVNLTTFQEDPQRTLSEIDIIINLAGSNIGEQRWTSQRKADILNSRVSITQLIAEQCALLTNPPTLLSASGVGIYGSQPVSDHLPTPLNESDPIDRAADGNFLSTVAKKWEQATEIAKSAGVRVVNMRFAAVLGHGGMLTKLSLPFQLGLGGPVGSGRQPFSWIALTDLVRAIDFLCHHPEISGPVNLAAPQCVSQSQFAAALAQSYHRPHFIKTPAFIIKLVFGEMGDVLLLNGQCAYPEVLNNHGFDFIYTDIKTTLQALRAHD